LLVSQILLLALVCAGIGVGTIIALQHFLTNQLDDRLAETGRRSAGLFEFGPPPPPPGFPGLPGFQRRMIIRDEMGPGPAFLNAPGQAARTVGAVVSHGTPVDAGVITADGTRSEISATAADQLAHVRPSH
jgi:two-component system OmpR family sensor kinase